MNPYRDIKLRFKRPTTIRDVIAPMPEDAKNLIIWWKNRALIQGNDWCKWLDIRDDYRSDNDFPMTPDEILKAGDVLINLRIIELLEGPDGDYVYRLVPSKIPHIGPKKDMR